MDSLFYWLNDIKNGLIFYLPITNPVLILAIVLLIILFAPLFSKLLKLPSIIGLILAGVFISPKAIHIIAESTSFELFSKTGMLYIMFLAGLEIDLNEYKKQKSSSLVFGALTFVIPLLGGLWVCYTIFHFEFISSLLIASIFSTHTLISYPIVSQMGIVKNKAVQVTFGGTIITDSAVLILLSIITSWKGGVLDYKFWSVLCTSLLLLLFSILIIIPKISKWVFRNIEGKDSSQYLYVLAVMFISSYLSQLAGIEPIVGAFLAGLVFNKIIPKNSALKNRIVFIGSTLFIPFFLISAGMLLDLRVFFIGINQLIFASILTAVAILTKFFAAQITGFIYKFNRQERKVMFGITVSHAAATLAVIKVGYDLQLIDQSVVNAIIFLILISCMVSSFVTESASRKIAISMSKAPNQVSDATEIFLIPILNPDNISRLLDLTLMLKNESNNEPIYPLTVVEEDEETSEKLHVVKRIVEDSLEHASKLNTKIEVLKKVDLSIASGIIRTAKAYDVSHVVINWDANEGVKKNIFINLSESILEQSSQALIVSNVQQPFNSFKRAIVFISSNSEAEVGVTNSIQKIDLLLSQLLVKTIVWGKNESIKKFTEVINDQKQLKYTYQNASTCFIDNIIKEIKKDDLYIILNGRKQTVSYDFNLNNLPKQIAKSHIHTSVLIYYMETQNAITDFNSDVGGTSHTFIQENLEKAIRIKERVKQYIGKSKQE